MLMDLPALHLVVKAAYRLRTNDYGTPQVQVGQHSEIFFKLEDNHIFMIIPSDRLKKTLIFNKPYRVLAKKEAT